MNDPLTPTVGGRGPLDFVVPGLIVGIPLAVVALIVFLQLVGGVAWLPVVRKWLGRRL